NQLCGLNIFGEGTYDASGNKALAEALVFNTSLNSITITEGAELPIGALRRNEITELDLSDKLLGPENAILLGAVLVFNTSLNTLDICDNGITGEAARQLAEVVLAHPSIKVFNKIQMQDLKDDKVTELDLSMKKIGVAGALVLGRLLVSNGSLNALHLGGNRIGSEGAKALAVALTPNAEGVFNTSLNTLTITDEVELPIGALRRNEITELDLRGSGSKRLQPEDAIILGAVLAFNTSLNSIAITKGVELPIGALRRNMLTELNFSRKGLRPEDAIILGAVLVFNTSLNTLDLGHNYIGDEGAKALAVALTPNAEGVFNGSLNTLDLRRNEIGPEGAKALAVALTPNEEGVFNTSLNTLDLGRNKIGDNYIGDEGAKALAVALTPNAEGVFNGSLNTLKLTGNHIGPEGAKALAVALTPNAEGVFNTSLNTLNIEWNDFGPVGAKALADALTPNAEGVFNGSLNTLDVSWNDVGPEGAKALAVALTPNAEGVFNTSLNTLHLGRNGIGPEGAKALAVALTPNAEGVFNTSLNKLNLYGNQIGPEGAEALAGALTPNAGGLFNTSMHTLDLSYNHLCGLSSYGSGTYDASGIKALAEALVFNTSLNTLDVRMNNITGDAAQQLAEAVLKHPCIKEFNEIRMQDIKDDKVAELDLRGKGIELPGALVLSKLLVFNGSLNTLNLSRNSLGSEDKTALREAVRKHPNAATFKLIVE
ncbi:hypothetical protein CYMTET_34468, partial [Cymbomonas tetramitiformis]